MSQPRVRFYRLREHAQALALAFLGLSASAATPEALTPGVQEIKPLKPIIVSLEWKMDPRAALGWNAYQSATNTYKQDYVHPRTAKVTFDMCRSRGGEVPIAAIVLQLINAKTRMIVRSQSLQGECAYATTLELGDYTATVIVANTAGEARSREFAINLRDYLVVAIGDSFASGEGNPDQPGSYELPSLSINMCQGKGTTFRREPVWKDRLCHRSAFSWPALAASRLESMDPHRSITFLSFACSGAGIENLIAEFYEGQEPNPPWDPSPMLLPQLAAVKAAVGGRQIDALLVAVGMNDLEFSDLVTACGSPWQAFKDAFLPGGDACVTGKLLDRLHGVDVKYDRLARRIKDSLNVKEVYIVDYPVNVLQDASGNPSTCECLDLGVGVNDSEASWLAMGGEKLNHSIAHAAARNKWNLIFGNPDRYEGRGYCASINRRFFVRVGESIQVQGPNHGGMHPNHQGHAATAELAAKAVVLGDSPKPVKKVTIEFTKVKYEPQQGASFINATFAVLQRRAPPFQNLGSWLPDLYTNFLHQEVPASQWVDLPKGRYVFSTLVFNAPAPLKYVTDMDVVAVGNGYGRSLTSLANMTAFGAGTHTLDSDLVAQSLRMTTPNPGTDTPKLEPPGPPLRGKFSVQIKVSVTDLDPMVHAIDPLGLTQEAVTK